MLIGLMALAGFVDVIALLSLGNFYAATMAGNATRLAASMAGDGGGAWLAAQFILAFAGGVVAATILARNIGDRHAAVTLALAAVLLALTAVLNRAHQPQPVMILAAAMGMVARLIRHGDDANDTVGTSVGITPLVIDVADGLANWITRDGALTGWLRPLLLFGSFIGGGLIAAGLFWRVGMLALWVAAIGAAAAAGWAYARPHIR